MREACSHIGVDVPEGPPYSIATSPEAYEAYLRGMYHSNKEQQSDNAVAMEFFREALARDSTFVPAIVQLATAQLTAFESGWEQHDEVLSDAEANSRRALRIDSARANAFVVLGAVQMARGNKEAGLSLYERALAIDPKNAPALTRIAIANLIDLGKPAVGLRYFKRLQESDPTDWQINSNVGIANAQLKNYVEAIQSFRRSLQYNPSYDVSWVNLGYVFERIAKFDSAVFCYEKALSLNPMYPLTYANLVSVLFAVGRYAEAESVLTQGTAYLQSDLEIQYALGLANHFLKRQAKAMQILKEGLRLARDRVVKNPRVATAHVVAALFHARAGSGAEAAAEAREAARLDSTDNEVLIKVARVYAVLGRKDQMLEWFRRAKAKNPEYDAAYLATAIDFEAWRKDPDLLLMARSE